MVRIPVDKRRELLLDATFRVIARHGVDGATTRAISAAAGVSLSSFHYVFESRDALLSALVVRGTEAELAAMSTVLEAAAVDPIPGVDGLSTMVHRSLTGYVDGMVADPERAQAMISLNQYARQTEGLAVLGEDMYRSYYQAIAEGLTAAAHITGVRWDRPVDELAPLVVAATDGITLAYLNTRDRRICDRIAESTVMQLVSHVTTVRTQDQE